MGEKKCYVKYLRNPTNQRWVWMLYNSEDERITIANKDYESLEAAENAVIYITNCFVNILCSKAITKED